MKVTIEITGADIEENIGGITRPDYPIRFTSNEFGDKSIDAIAQEYGRKKWNDMHGEMPRHVYYIST